MHTYTLPSYSEESENHYNKGSSFTDTRSSFISHMPTEDSFVNEHQLAWFVSDYIDSYAIRIIVFGYISFTTFITAICNIYHSSLVVAWKAAIHSSDQ